MLKPEVAVSDLGEDLRAYNSERKAKIKRFAIVFGVFVGIMIAILLTYVHFNLMEASRVLISPAGLKAVAQGSIAVAIGFGTSILYTWWDNNPLAADIRKKQKDVPDGLFYEGLSLLSRHGSIFVLDYKVEHFLSATDTDGLYRMKVIFSYRKRFTHRQLSFIITRVRTPLDSKEFDSDEYEDEKVFVKDELSYDTYEVDLIGKFGQEKIDEIFKFCYIKVNGRNVVPTHGENFPDEYYCYIPDDIKIMEPLEIEYSLEYAVPPSDIRYCNVVFPTHGVEIAFVREGNIRDRISADAFELMTKTRGRARVSERSPGLHSIRHKGWVLPKSGAGFYWYPSNEP